MDPLQFGRKVNFGWIITVRFIRSRSYIPLCRAELSGNKTQEEKCHREFLRSPDKDVVGGVRRERDSGRGRTVFT